MANVTTEIGQAVQANVVAPPPQRRRRAETFQGWVLVAAVVFVALAVLARLSPYFPIDLAITRAVQGIRAPLFDRLMFAYTWVGFLPQAAYVGMGIIAVIFLLGLRWEATALTFSGAGFVIGMLVKAIVYRPRPAADLVRVLGRLNSYSFPSGHVLTITLVGGFLAFLVFTLLKPSWLRTALLVFLGLSIPLMGLSRIYEGQHWFSDVMGAYLLGSLWLALAIKVYRWGKPRFFVRQPAAPEKTPAKS